MTWRSDEREDRRAVRASRLLSAAAVVHCLAPDLEFGVLAATGPVGWLVGLCSVTLAVCWRITTPITADALPAGIAVLRVGRVDRPTA